MMVWPDAEEFWYNPPSLFFLSSLYNAPGSLAAKQPQCMILPPPCLKGGTVFLGLMPHASGHYGRTTQFVSHLTIKLSSIKLFLCPCGQMQTLLELEAQASFLDSSLLFCGSKTRLTVNSDTSVPAVSCAMMFPGLFLTIQTSFLSAKDESLTLHADLSKVATPPNNMHLCTIV